MRREGERTQLLGLLAFGDSLKASARDAVARLHELGISTVMLTGDNRGSAAAVARALGIDDCRAEVLPGDKAEAMQALRARARWWRWSATASTTRRRWRRPMSASRCPPAPTSRWRPPASR